MKKEEREALNEQTAIIGETPATITDIGKVRRVSIDSISVLQMVGSPFASVFASSIRGEDAEEIKPSMTDICVFIWAHCADPDEVLDIALQCRPDCPTEAVRAAVKHCRAYSLSDLSPIVNHILYEAVRLRAAASFEARAPELGTKKKSIAKARQQSRS